MVDFINTTGNLSEPVCAPSGLGGMFECANHYTSGFITVGFLGVVWFVVFNTGLYLGYRALPSMIAANFVATLVSFILYTGKYVPAQVPFVAMVALAGSWALAYVYSPS